MPDLCAICGKKLIHGEDGNAGSCYVCRIKICKRCTRYGFCPAHFRALSPRGQTLVRKVYLSQWVLIPLVSLMIVLWAVGLIPGAGSNPFYSDPWLLVVIAVPIAYTVGVRVWLPRLWRRDTARPALSPETWHCSYCRFENPSLVLACGNCGRQKLPTER